MTGSVVVEKGQKEGVEARFSLSVSLSVSLPGRRIVEEELVAKVKRKSDLVYVNYNISCETGDKQGD